MAASSAPSFRLRANLVGHSSDVRGVSSSPSGEIATASRDNNVLLWDLNEPSAPLKTLSGHQHWVNSVLFIDSSRVATGCADGSVRVWDAQSGEVVHDIKAHKLAACALSSDGNILISSSWDKSARVWDLSNGSPIQTFAPHDAAVWDSLPLKNGQVITVAADKTVRLWPKGSGRSIVLATAHTDVVRAVCHGPMDGFITVANDSALVYWKPTAGGEFTPAGGIPNLHDGNYIYSIYGSEKDGKWTFVTSGEDNCVRVTHAYAEGGNVSFKSVQSIMHPGTVWDVELCPNGDLVTACSDDIARVFTLNPELAAADDVIAAFDAAVSSRKVSTKVIGGVDPSKLESADSALIEPGTKDGQNKIVKSADGTPEVYMWSAADKKWTKIGDVVDDPSGGISAGTILGKSYDFCFDVELGDSGPKKKLGYNRGENPYLAAQRFIDDNELDQNFLDQIASFITTQVPADALGQSNQSSDPLTGGGRYVPGSGTNGRRSTQASDPLTGGGRYVPGGAARPAKAPVPRHIPMQSGLIQFLKSNNITAIAQKVKDNNKKVREELGVGGLIDGEMEVFATCLVPKLEKVGSGATVMLEDEECVLIEQLVEFPTELVFASLDVARIAIGLPTGATYFFGKKNGSILDTVLEHARSPNAGPAVLIMACRFVCNMFANRIVSTVVAQKCETILTSCSAAAKSPNKRARETFASLLNNYAYSLHTSKAAASESKVVMEYIVRTADGEKDESVLYLLNVALGSLMKTDEATRVMGVQLGAAKLAAEAAPVSSRLQQTAEEMARLIVRE